MDDTWFNKLQKIIFFLFILSAIFVVGPQLNEYRKVISTVKEMQVEAAKYSTSQEVQKEFLNKLQNLNISLTSPDISVSGKGSDTSIEISYRKTITLSSKIDVVIDYHYPF